MTDHEVAVSNAWIKIQRAADAGDGVTLTPAEARQALADWFAMVAAKNDLVRENWSLRSAPKTEDA